MLISQLNSQLTVFKGFWVWLTPNSRKLTFRSSTHESAKSTENLAIFLVFYSQNFHTDKRFKIRRKNLMLIFEFLTLEYKISLFCTWKLSEFWKYLVKTLNSQPTHGWLTRDNFFLKLSWLNSTQLNLQLTVNSQVWLTKNSTYAHPWFCPMYCPS